MRREGLSYAQIEERTGVNQDTVRYHLARKERPRAEDDTRPMPQTNGEGECTTEAER